MDTQQLDIEHFEHQGNPKEFLSLFLGLKWALIVFCVSIVTSIVVAPWFLFFGSLFAIALAFGDTRVSSFFTKRITKLLDSEYDELETVFGEIRPQLGRQYSQLLLQAMEVYRELKAGIRERGMLAESFGDVFPAIQVLMDKILHLAKKPQLIDSCLRCHDDVDHTRMVFDH